MGVDWFTVVAQIINFLLLVYLLKRFLYAPVIKAMEGRQARIRESLAAAERREETAKAEAREFERRQAELEERRDEMLSIAESEASSFKEDLVRDARREVGKLRREWRCELQREKRQFASEIRRSIGRQVLETARSALRDLCDAALERQMVTAFLERLRSLSEGDRELLHEESRRDGVHVVTSGELSEEARRSLAAALRAELGADREVEFRRSDELVCGIELETGGRRVSWSVDQYLKDLDEELRCAVGEEASSTEECEKDAPSDS